VITGGAEFKPYENNEPFNGPEDRMARNDSDERDALSLGGTGDMAQSIGSQTTQPDPSLGNNDPDQSSDARREGYGSAFNTNPLPRMHPPLAGLLTVRRDSHGGGMRGDPRSRKDPVTGKTYKYSHEGTDVVAKAGEEVLSPVDGVITRVDVDPYGDGRFKGIEIVSNDGKVVRIHYSAAHGNLKAGDNVSADTSIGTAQDRAAGSKGMINHIHVEVWQRKDGQPAAPRAYGKADLKKDFVARDPWLAFQ
jgi:murein DD-endopeptidase MepM/ murein hydrolase activator NlpD